ncbi:AaceriAGL054Wp [[Ashbya] aceris (nom. inval.)]|nr:AaceriAGL054Wp [[Ashbya] aceris (nom. inval.)]
MFRPITAQVGKRLGLGAPMRGSALAGRWASTLAFIESHKPGEIATSSLSALEAAKKLGNPVTALVVGHKLAGVAQALQSVDCSLLQRIVVADSAEYEHYLPERVAPLCAQLLKDPEYSHFVVAASAVGKNILPRVGALLDVQPVSDIVEVKDQQTFTRPIYAGNVLVTVQDPQATKLLSIRASAFAAVGAGSNSANVESAPEVPAPAIDIVWQSNKLLSSDRPELGSAKRVVTGGRGLKNKETFDELLEPLATTLGAAIGATRAAVDAGFCDNSLQIGQTGKVVAPELYVAVGVSGAIQHLAGMKDAKTIVAINKDPEAPIFQVADYGLVGDLNAIVPELTQKLAE